MFSDLHFNQISIRCEHKIPLKAQSSLSAAFNYKLKGKPTYFSHLPDLRTAQSRAAGTEINKGNPECPSKSLFYYAAHLVRSQNLYNWGFIDEEN